MVIHLMVNVCIFLKFIFLYVITIMRYPIYSYINFKVSQVKSHSLVFQVRYVWLYQNGVFSGLCKSNHIGYIQIRDIRFRNPVGMRLLCKIVNVYLIAYRVHVYTRASLVHSPDPNPDSSNRISPTKLADMTSCDAEIVNFHRLLVLYVSGCPAALRPSRQQSLLFYSLASVEDDGGWKPTVGPHLDPRRFTLGARLNHPSLFRSVPVSFSRMSMSPESLVSGVLGGDDDHVGLEVATRRWRFDEFSLELLLDFELRTDNTTHAWCTYTRSQGNF